MPGYRLIFAELQQQIELLDEELVVVGQGVPEQRERLGNEPLPTISSARPLDSKSRGQVLKTRTGSAD